MDVHSHLQAAEIQHEIIVVDDGSKDQTWEAIKKAKQQINSLKAFRLGKNFGQHKATLCGLMHCSGDWIVTIDDDFEHSPAKLLDLLTEAKKTDADIYYAIPSNRPKSFLRTLVSSIYKRISRVENADAGKGSSWRVIRSTLVEKLKEHPHHLFFIDEILLWYTGNIATGFYEFEKPRKDNSGYNYPKLFSLSKDVFIISTTLPLTMVKLLGFSVSLISFSLGLYHFLHKLFFPTEKGYTSLILSILFSTGLILFCIGIIGEYLANLVLMQNKKPPFYISEKI